MLGSIAKQSGDFLAYAKLGVHDEEPGTIQGLCNEFQMTGANHYLMTLILSKVVQFSFFSES